MPSANPGDRANYRIDDLESATVVHVFDAVDLSNVSMLGDALFGSLGRGLPVVIDLSPLEHIDSVGLHLILRVFQRAELVRLDAVLVAEGLIRQLVNQVGLDRLVPVAPDVAAALAVLDAKARSRSPVR